MKANELKINEWYWIEYLPLSKSKRKYVGPAKFKGRYSENKDSLGFRELQFYSPLDDSESGMMTMCFFEKHVKYVYSPLPNYIDLYEKVFGIKFDPNSADGFGK